MANYLPAIAPGTSRVRAVSASLQNTYGFDPSIVWMQEEQILMADGSFKYVQIQPLYTQVNAELLNADIPVINPDTGEVMETIKGYKILQIIVSLFVQQAKAKEAADAALAASAN